MGLASTGHAMPANSCGGPRYYYVADDGSGTPPDAGCMHPERYVPPSYTNVAAGDAILNPLPQTCPPQDVVCQMMLSIQMTYSHVALAWDNSGGLLAETQWDTNPPGSTHSTGGDHYCSRVIDSGWLQNLHPGTTGTGTVDPNHTIDGSLVIPQVGTPYCNTPADQYHFNSFLHGDTYGGSCEKYLVDYCGVNVQPGDVRQLQPDELNLGLQTVYGAAYQATMYAMGGMVSAGALSFACGGVDYTIEAQRGSFQFINEILWKWWQLYVPDGHTTDYLGQDANAMGKWTTAPGGGSVWEDFGGAAQNTQWSGDGWDYCTNVNQPYQTPNGVLQGEGASCASWQNHGNPTPINMPDNVVTANNNHIGHNPYAAQAQAGYTYEDTSMWKCVNICDGDGNLGY